MSLRGYAPVLVLCSFDFANLCFCDLWIICVFVPFCKSLSFKKMFDLFSVWEFVLRCLAFVCCDVLFFG